MSPALLATMTILAVTVSLIVSALTGAVAALLARAEGATPAVAVIRAGIAFGATPSLITALVTTVAGLLN